MRLRRFSVTQRHFSTERLMPSSWLGAKEIHLRISEKENVRIKSSPYKFTTYFSPESAVPHFGLGFFDSGLSSLISEYFSRTLHYKFYLFDSLSHFCEVRIPNR